MVVVSAPYASLPLRCSTVHMGLGGIEGSYMFSIIKKKKASALASVECFAEAVELVQAQNQVLARNLRIRGVHEVVNIFYVFWRPVLESGVLSI